MTTPMFVKFEQNIIKRFSELFGMKFLWLEVQQKLDNLDIRRAFEIQFQLIVVTIFKKNVSEKSWG